MHILEWLLLAYLLVVFPAWELSTSGSLRQRLRANPAQKVSMYRTTCLQLWPPALLLLALLWTNSLSVAQIPVFVPLNFNQGFALLGLLALTVYLGISLRAVANDFDTRKKTGEALKPAAWMLPVTRREAVWFIGPVSLTAGICEELLYRAYLVQWFELAMPIWAAVILSSVVFGLIHAYQGVSGMLRSAAIGLVLASIFVATGSLLVPIALHIFIDVYSGALSWIALREESTPTVDAGPATRHSGL